VAVIEATKAPKKRILFRIIFKSIKNLIG